MRGSLVRLETKTVPCDPYSTVDVLANQLAGFDWSSLPAGSTVVDVGGGIGSTSMVLALAAECEALQFVVQDREVVVGMGKKVRLACSVCPFYSYGKVDKAHCTGLACSAPGTTRIRARAVPRSLPLRSLVEKVTNPPAVHDFFTPQPIKHASVFLLRVILHDWPDAFARRILMRLREAAREPGWKGGGRSMARDGDWKRWDEGTKLVIADFVLPLACVDEFGSSAGVEEGGESRQRARDEVEGAQSMLALPPLLPNLGKASAHAYWMDLTVSRLRLP